MLHHTTLFTNTPFALPVFLTLRIVYKVCRYYVFSFLFSVFTCIIIYFVTYTCLYDVWNNVNMMLLLHFHPALHFFTTRLQI